MIQTKDYYPMHIITKIKDRQTFKNRELTAEVWKAMTERKSSEVLLAKGRQVDELRSPENSPNPFPLAWYAKEQYGNVLYFRCKKEREIKT